MNDIYNGIDLSKVTITSGDSLDKTTGIVSDYALGLPITYTYACGVSRYGKEELNGY